MSLQKRILERKKERWEKILKYEMDKINEHLPKKKRDLKYLLQVDSPYIECRDGSISYLDKEELLYLSNLIPPKYHGKLNLPIVLLRRMDLGKGTFTIAGGKIEQYVIRKVLGDVKESLDKYKLETPFYIYWPHIREIKKKLKTVIQIGFVFSLSEYY